jgi:hypothetical protein
MTTPSYNCPIKPLNYGSGLDSPPRIKKKHELEKRGRPRQRQLRDENSILEVEYEEIIHGRWLNRQHVDTPNQKKRKYHQITENQEDQVQVNHEAPWQRVRKRLNFDTPNATTTQAPITVNLDNSVHEANEGIKNLSLENN